MDIKNSLGATKTKPTAGGDLGGYDWAGAGLQLGGAVYSDFEAKRQREEEERIRREVEAQRRLESGRGRMDMLRQNADELALQNRGANQRGLDYITGLVGENQKQGRRTSFESALLAHGGY